MIDKDKPNIFGVGVILEKNNKVLIIKEATFNESINKEVGMHSYPLERVFLGESIFEAAKRGYREEVGLDIELINIVGFYHFKGGFGIAFRGKMIDQNQSIMKTDEISEFKWMSKDELEEIQNFRPGVKESLNDYFKGKIYPLEIITDCR